MQPNLSADKKYWIVRSFTEIAISDSGSLFYSTIRGKGTELFSEAWAIQLAVKEVFGSILCYWKSKEKVLLTTAYTRDERYGIIHVCN